MITTETEIKQLVKDKYSEIAEQSKEANAASCCGVGGCATVDYAVFAEEYKDLKGYNPDADLGLGCGLPTEFAKIKEGDTVVDLGSGAGNDCFVARAIVGEKGKVIGVDMTETMIEKARANAENLGFNNVEFRLGDIERLPITANVVDVVVSNCVVNLVPNKKAVMQEVYRVLKPNGHFSISDVVIRGNLPDALKNDAEMYAGCVAGAIQLEEYLQIISQAGFSNITVQKDRKITLPQEILANYNLQELPADSGIYSVTVYAEKTACDPNSGCC